MSTGNNVRTYFQGKWHDEDLPIMRAADHGSWLGSNVFDGARFFDGVAPDLRAHCDRINSSAKSMMITPTVSTDQMVEIVWEGLKRNATSNAVYIRPMYWALDGDELAIVPKENSTGFAICLEDIAMSSIDKLASLTTTKFRRPVLEDNVVNAKSGCLYPNNARMLTEARSRGFSNALVTDIAGNVAETATSNIFLVKGGEVFTPIPNGTFLAGITRARHIDNFKKVGIKVHETVLNFHHFHQADEVFMSGNMMKVTAVSKFDDTIYELGPVTRKALKLYLDWSHSKSE